MTAPDVGIAPDAWIGPYLVAAGLVPAGEHTLQVELQFGAERRRNAVRWTVVANTEP